MLTAMTVSLTAMLVWIFLLLFCINTGFRKWVIQGCPRPTRTKANRKTLIGMGTRRTDNTRYYLDLLRGCPSAFGEGDRGANTPLD